MSDDAFQSILTWLETNVDLDTISTFVSGGAKGADALAETLAKYLGKDIQIFPPNWKQFGRSAPLIRNQQIASFAEACLAVVDKPLEQSTGTHHCVSQFQKLGKNCWVLELFPNG